MKKERINITLDSEIVERGKQSAKILGLSFSAYLTTLIVQDERADGIRILKQLDAKQPKKD